MTRRVAEVDSNLAAHRAAIRLLSRAFAMPGSGLSGPVVENNAKTLSQLPALVNGKSWWEI